MEMSGKSDLYHEEALGILVMLSTKAKVFCSPTDVFSALADKTRNDLVGPFHRQSCAFKNEERYMLLLWAWLGLACEGVAWAGLVREPTGARTLNLTKIDPLSVASDIISQVMDGFNIAPATSYLFTETKTILTVLKTDSTTLVTCTSYVTDVSCRPSDHHYHTTTVPYTPTTTIIAHPATPSKFFIPAASIIIITSHTQDISKYTTSRRPTITQFITTTKFIATSYLSTATNIRPIVTEIYISTRSANDDEANTATNIPDTTTQDTTITMFNSPTTTTPEEPSIQATIASDEEIQPTTTIPEVSTTSLTTEPAITTTTTNVLPSMEEVEGRGGRNLHTPTSVLDDDTPLNQGVEARERLTAPGLVTTVTRIFTSITYTTTVTTAVTHTVTGCLDPRVTFNNPVCLHLG
ncbi:uncharacterized protein [Cherax quadricarinatus]|uniref:uncharacterized protein n=1 Tax=Cherax quadricarinatus TaxID=27406 RepID=UPI00387E2878